MTELTDSEVRWKTRREESAMLSFFFFVSVHPEQQQQQQLPFLAPFKGSVTKCFPHGKE